MPRPHTEKITTFFSSMRLAVLLLIILATVSVIGTFIPQAQDPQIYIQRYGEATYAKFRLLGFIDLYHSWGFRAIVAMLGLNLLVCSLKRLKGIIRRTFRPDAEKSPEFIRGLNIHNDLPSPDKVHVLERSLTDKKYRIIKSGRNIYAAKGILGPWGDMITHLSILTVLVGALVGSLGFVGTINIYEGDWSDQYYNWNRGRNESFGFRLNVDNLSVVHYPVSFKIMVRDRATGVKVGIYKAVEGSTLLLSDKRYKLIPEKVDLERREAILDIYSGERVIGTYDTGLPEGGPLAPPLFIYSFVVHTMGEPVTKSIASRVRLTKDGQTVKEAVVEVNRPLKFEGLVIYQTAYGKDPQGRYYSGFQVVRDPGVPVVWAGFILLMAGLFLSFYFYHRQVWIYIEDDRVIIGGTSNKDTVGFMREYGGIIKAFMQEVEP